MTNLESKPDAPDRSDLDRHVARMLSIAEKRHPDFVMDCLTEPGRLAEHWSKDVLIEYVEQLDDHHPSTSTVVDDAYDLSGLFTLALPPKRKSIIQVKYSPGSYTARRNFTLLHELGHYLQQTDDYLVDALISHSGTRYGEKLFEEQACNRFASLSLLPDDYVKTFLDGRPVTAGILDEIFEHGRSRTKWLRVSRPVIVRRLADFLSDTGTITLVAGRSAFRISKSGSIEFFDKSAPQFGMTEAEYDLYTNLSNQQGKKQANISHCLHDTDGRQIKISVARSESGRNPQYFIVTELRAQSPSARSVESIEHIRSARITMLKIK